MLGRLFFLGVIALFCISATAEEVLVAVAANFSAPMTEIAAAFEKETNHKIKLATGSSGKFYAQIKNGAPFHIFLSADQSTPLVLENEGFTVPGTRFTYATGALALFYKRPNLVDSAGKNLLAGNFDKLAIANPKLAPYGAAAVEVMQTLGVYEKLKPKLVQGENIAQTFQFVETGNADLGFVALSQVINTEKAFWRVPTNLHTPIRQDAVLLKDGEHNTAAKALIEFFRMSVATEIIRLHGYESEQEI